MISTSASSTGLANQPRLHAPRIQLKTAAVQHSLLRCGLWLCVGLACTGCRGISDLQDPFAAAENESGRSRPGITRVAKANQNEDDSPGRVQLGGQQGIVDPFLATGSEPAFDESHE